jgi:hypothetical protein
MDGVIFFGAAASVMVVEVMVAILVGTVVAYAVVVAW